MIIILFIADFIFWKSLRKDNAPQNFAIIRQIAVNLLGKEKRVKRGVKNKQFLAAMDNDYLLRVLALA